MYQGMMQSTNLPKTRYSGQGMTEYIIIVALIAIAAITAVSLFGETIQAQFAGLAGALSGNGSGTGIKAAQEAAGNAVNAVGSKSLGNYGN